MQQASKYRQILLLSSDARETSVLIDILQRHVALTNASSVVEMMALLPGNVYDALLCDWRFDGGTWRDVITLLKEHDPSLPVIVLSPAGGEYEWLEALDSGAFDLLAAPWHKPTVIGALEHAFASRDARILRGSHQRLGEDMSKVMSLL